MQKNKHFLPAWDGTNGGFGQSIPHGTSILRHRRLSPAASNEAMGQGNEPGHHDRESDMKPKNPVFFPVCADPGSTPEGLRIKLACLDCSGSPNASAVSDRTKPDKATERVPLPSGFLIYRIASAKRNRGRVTMKCV
jgi:hypothetical protein